MKEILLETRVKNNRLVRLIKKDFESISAFCLTYEINLQTMYALIGFNYRVYSRVCDPKISGMFSRPTPLAQKVSAILERNVEWLFPPELYMRAMGMPKNRWYVHQVEIGIKAMRQMGMSTLSQPREIGFKSKIEENQSAEVVENILKQQLNEHHRRIIKMLFGFNGKEPMNCRQIAEIENVSINRIQQIERQALCYLRKPRILKLLEQA